MEMKMIEMGIVSTISGAPSDALKTMSPDEAHRAKRKFRKQWRKAVKWMKTAGLDYERLCGKSEDAQTVSQKRFRRGIVAKMVKAGIYDKE
jgi:2-iminoacetate synthase ThiH